MNSGHCWIIKEDAVKKEKLEHTVEELPHQSGHDQSSKHKNPVSEGGRRRRRGNMGRHSSRWASAEASNAHDSSSRTDRSLLLFFFFYKENLLAFPHDLDPVTDQ